MRKIKRILEVYRYEELPDEAKEKIKQDYIDSEIPNEMFSECVQNYFYDEYPKSKLDVHYSLSYSQGDGLTVSGTLHVFEIIKKLIEEQALTEDELEDTQYIDEDTVIQLPQNLNYNYFHIKEEWIEEDLKEETINYITETQNIDEWEENDDNILTTVSSSLPESIKNIAYKIHELLRKECSEWEQIGYKELYEISEEEMKEICDCNDEWYYITGKLYIPRDDDETISNDEEK